MKIGIVGPDEFAWTEEQKPRVKEKIKDIFYKYAYVDGCNEGDVGWVVADYRKCVLVSGHCPKGGVDIWAEVVADGLGIKKEIYPAEVNQWEDKLISVIHDRRKDGFPDSVHVERLKGYRSRNIQVAEASDVLYCVVPKILPKFKYRLTFADVQRERLQENSYCKHCNTFGHPTNGGCWTMKYAKKLGKETHLVVITSLKDCDGIK